MRRGGCEQSARPGRRRRGESSLEPRSRGGSRLLPLLLLLARRRVIVVVRSRFGREGSQLWPEGPAAESRRGREPRELAGAPALREPRPGAAQHGAQCGGGWRVDGALGVAEIGRRYRSRELPRGELPVCYTSRAVTR